MIRLNSRNHGATPERSRSHRAAPFAWRSGMLIVLFLAVLVSGYDVVQALSSVTLSDLQPLDWAAGQRLLVIAPHPDDEVLAAGGLIQRTLDSGGQVRVVIVTNGDAQPLAPLVVDHKIRATQADYVRMGRQRQLESLAALRTLGVDPDAVAFLGYPDRGLYALWLSNWREAAPLISPYTRAARSPYENTFDPGAEYLGADLYNDLLRILMDFHPDVVVLPHPEDTHPDHDATSSFARLALVEYLSATGAEPPRVLAYLVHYEGYPLPRGDSPGKALLPPAPLTRGGAGWLTYSLNREEQGRKQTALRAYSSQIRMMRGYLKSFGRANEIFFEMPPMEMPRVGFEDAGTFEGKQDVEIGLPEPQRERFERLMLPAADLVGLKVVRLEDVLCFWAETRAPLNSRLDYRITLKLPDGGTLTASRQDGLVLFAPRQFGVCYTLEDLGHPDGIGFSAESRYRGTLDRTAWSFLRLLYDEQAPR